MAKLVCVIPGKELSNPDRDFRSAVRVEQYRISGEALFIPEGFHWKYYPLSAVDGHCVAVREKRPELDLTVGSEIVHLQLEKETSMQTILSAIKK